MKVKDVERYLSTCDPDSEVFLCVSVSYREPDQCAYIEDCQTVPRRNNAHPAVILVAGRVRKDAL